MKKLAKTKLPKFRTKLIVVVCALLCVTCFTKTYGQSLAPPPQAEWKKATWNQFDLYKNSIYSQQANPASEWWYVHRNLYDPSTGKHIGYLAGGYQADNADYGDMSIIQQIYNEGGNSSKNPYLSTINYFSPTLASGGLEHQCEDFYDLNTPGNRARTNFRGTVARLDLKGNVVWMDLPCETGEGILEILQDGNYFYVIGRHNGAKTMDYAGNGTNKVFLQYNPSSTGSAVFDKSVYSSLNPTMPMQDHMYIAKYNLNGTIVWQAIYGVEDFWNNPINDTWDAMTQGSDIILNSNGKLYAVGHATKGGNNPYNKAFVMEIEPSNGFVINTLFLPMPNTYNSLNQPANTCVGKTICQINSAGDMAIAGDLGYFDPPANPTYIDNVRGFVCAISSGLTVGSGSWPTWASNPITFPAAANTGGIKASSIWEINYRPIPNQINGELLVGLVGNCVSCGRTGDNHAEGFIVRMATTNGAILASHTMGPINAYDLRVGVIPTSDGGFAAVSSRRNTTPPTITSSDLGPFASCPDLAVLTNNGVYQTIDTDPLIVKYNASNVKEWEWSEDVVPGSQRVLYPGDFKRQECMYKITEAEDGGLVVSGNCSYNHDDNYMAKLYSKCNNQQTYTYPTGTVVGQSDTWTTSRTIKGVLTIPAGYTLTISGATTKIRFADTKMTGVTSCVQILPGGCLKVINGAELTSIDNAVCPGSMWDGIAVVGNFAAGQGNANDYSAIAAQGYLSINSATISNARCGVITAYMAYLNNNYSGGVIDATNAYFVNNQRDVQIQPYLNPNNAQLNKSRFRGCHFLINAPLNNGEKPEFRVYMENVDNVGLLGNEFNYTAGSAYQPTDRGWGIYSNDAAYFVRDYVVGATSTQSSFNDFRYGIEADNCNSLRTVNVDHANFTTSFTNNTDMTGAMLFHTNNTAQITGNNIYLSSWFAFGISINNSSNYSVRNNTVTGTNGLNSVGIYASNSGIGDHRIYRNNLNNLDGGIFAQYDNGNINNASDGLIMNCNTFTGNNGDVAMLTDNTVVPTVRKNQGFGNTGATFVRNRYSASCSLDNQWYIDLSNGQQNNSNYLINHKSNATAISPYLVTPACANPLVILTDDGSPFSFATQCASTGNRPQVNSSCPCRNCCNKVDIQAALSNAEASANTLQNAYNNNLDGGHTAYILTQIANPASDESDLLTHLTFHVGYLSDAVLTAYFNRSTVPAANIIQVHNGNKPVTEAVWQVLQNHGLDPGTMADLTTQQNQNSISTRQMAEDNLGHAKSVMQSLYAEKLNYFLLDSTETAKDSVMAMLNTNTGNLPGVELLKLRAYAAAGNYSGAFGYATELSSNTALAEAVEIEKAFIQLDTAATGAAKLKTNTALYNTVAAYAADPSKAGHWQAEAAMRHAFGTPMSLHYLNRPINQSRTMNSNGNAANNSTVITAGASNNSHTSPVNKTMDVSNVKELNGIEFQMFPNPATSNVNLFVKSRSQSEVTYTVLDILGRQINAGAFKPNTNYELDIQDFRNGVYFVSLVQDNAVIDNQKLTLIK